MNKEELFISGAEGYQLSLAVYPASEAKATIICVHGMQEYKERYDEFASFLQSNGYNVVTSDMRGHGKHAPRLSHIASKHGDQLIIADYKIITKYVKERFPNKPLILFGHSMGTIISRVLLQSEDKEFSKVVLSGYVNPNPASGVAVCLGNIVRFFKGGERYSKLLASLALGSFAKAVKDRKTDLDWLSYNEENVKNYIADPLCGVDFTIGSFDALFHLLNRMGKAKKYIDINKDLPILLVSGKDDPCTGGEKGRNSSVKVLHKAGYQNISQITYDNMRHEILNETEKEKVYKDILEFLNK